MIDSLVKSHFNVIANDYDHYKKMNWYYYKNLKILYSEIIKPNNATLEVGCGTGDLINEVKSRQKIGIDISDEMISIAKRKYPEIIFYTSTLENFNSKVNFDYIFFADVIEHLENVSSTIENLSKLVTKNKTIVVFTYANPLWEPILLIAEWLKLKMPEGPHYRIPFSKFQNILELNNLEVVQRGWRLLIPKNIPYISNLVNSFFYKIPILNRFGMLEYILIRKK